MVLSDCATLALVAAATEGVIFDGTFTVDSHLITFEYIPSIHLPSIELSLRATEAHGREFLDVVSYFKQPFAAREDLTTEVSPEAVADNGYITVLGHAE